MNGHDAPEGPMIHLANAVLLPQKVPVTTSLKVADRFGKRHDHVVESIRNIQKTMKSQKISLPDFRESEYVSERGKTYPMFEMNRKGFMLLVMGFTGEKAMKMKSDYIDAFDATDYWA